ncbi:lipoprotein insertase outer membrane protein LolB [Pseudoxanthomonas sp. JBR18]|uniref:lipoprotein insertase outer membrane protein LolB n=1 Tax=Pseudoxanthomonas sp. JBR18 TaxID=2969308 RepID=UPI002304DCEA|nr:lipoprotein insertase outer membrane protein LolB [Pseudoxanthomonas sp. JBR18]WCE02857.1 lipoprotein insertase outer membrane protein LolB [Pseudoxanthomonas sp. JBR18]
MKSSLKTAASLALAMLLAGCTTLGPRPTAPAAGPADPAAAAANQAARERWLQAHPDWALEGRVAIRRADKGGSGRIDWRQRGAQFDVSLSAPVTRQSWRLTGDGQGVLLEGLDGGPLRGADAGQLLLAATGWEIPVQALAYWIRGQAAPGPAPGDLQYGADGLPALLEQSGWRIAYTAWQPAGADVPALPSRIEAERGDSRVRLIIDAWQPAGAATP